MTARPMLSFEVGTYFEKKGHLLSFKAEPPCGHTVQSSWPGAEIAALMDLVETRDGSSYLKGKWTCLECGKEYENPSASVWINTNRFL